LQCLGRRDKLTRSFDFISQFIGSGAPLLQSRLCRNLPTLFLFWLAGNLCLSLMAVPLPKKLTLRGVVRLGEEGTPVRGALVHLDSLRGDTYDETYTWVGGKFSFKNLPAGQYSVIVLARGYPKVRKTVDITPSFADSSGKVEITVEIQRPGAGQRARDLQQTVSVRRLTVSKKAEKEYERARKAAVQSDYDAMVRHLRKAIELEPQFAEAMNDLGTHYHRAQRYEEAIELFRSASRVDPDAFTPHLNLGGSLLEAGRPIEALEANGRALELDSSDSLAHAQMGIALFTLGHHQPALFHLNEAKRIDPGSASSPQLILADIYLRQGRKDRAISELEDFLALHPDLPSAVNVRKEIESLKGNGE